MEMTNTEKKRKPRGDPEITGDVFEQQPESSSKED